MQAGRVFSPQVAPATARSGPFVPSRSAARAPELAVLSVIAHGKGANGASVGKAALSACAALDDERTRLYVDLIFLHLSDAARAALEGEVDLKKYEYQSEFARKYVAAGKAEGKAEGKTEGKLEAVVLVLEGRGLHVDDEAKQRLASLDSEELDVVLGKAALVSSLDELFST